MELDTNIIEILELIRNKSLTKEQLEEELKQYHESDIADAVPLLSEEEQIEFFKKLSAEEVGELFTYIDSPEDYIEEMAPEKAADIIETMDADDAVDILEEIDEEVVQDILEEMEQEAREDVELIQTYDDEVIGSKITTNYILINKGSSIKEAMKQLVSQASENDNISNLFVVNSDETYYGTIILKDLIIARQGTDLDDITKTSYPVLYADELVDEVINEIKDIDLEIIPVLDRNEKIIGVITSSDIIEAVDEEMSEDYSKFAAITESEDIDESFLQSVKKRFPWLSLLLVLNILTTTVLSGFSWIFAAIPSLVLFQSWILDSSGNAGTQSLATTIRMITGDKIKGKMFGRALVKELLTGLIDGLLVGTCAFLVSFVFLKLSNTPVEVNGVTVSQFKCSLVVGISLFSAVPFTTLAGLLLPILFSKIHIDPAVASGPLLTTFCDAAGVAVYYTFAEILFMGLL